MSKKAPKKPPLNRNLEVHDGVSRSDLEDRILDAYAQEGDIVSTAIRLNVDLEVVREVLEDPKLAERILARRRGVLTLDFFTKVVPGLLDKASHGEAGATQAARMILDLTGISKPKMGRPKDSEAGERSKTIEQMIDEAT